MEGAIASTASLGYLAGNTVLSPDLDTPSSPQRVWGLLGTILWLPYRLLVRHRGPLSHWMILGAFFQHVYLIVMVFIWAFAIFALWNGLVVPFTDIGRVLAAQPIDWVMFRYLASGVFFVISSKWYWIFLFGHILGAGLHVGMDAIQHYQSKQYHGVPPSQDEQEAALRGQ